MLYHVLAEHLETFLERVERDGRRLPRFVVEELRGFLRCGIRAYGFARVRCPSCRHEFAVAFSCKGRGFCPSCGGRFMGQSAAHLVDNVLPGEVGYRQWVLTLPFDLRYRVAYDSELCSAILRAFSKTLSAWHLRRAAQAGVDAAQWGGVTVVQRFGSALQLLPHFHTIACDGVFRVSPGAERAQVVRLPAPSDQDVEGVVEEVYRRVVRVLRHRGLLPDEDAAPEPDPMVDAEPSLAACYANAVRAPRRLVGEQWSPSPGTKAVSKSALCARYGGFDLHAGVTVSPHDRMGLERLCRYVCRPALSHDRLELLDEAHVGQAECSVESFQFSVLLATHLGGNRHAGFQSAHGLAA